MLDGVQAEGTINVRRALYQAFSAEHVSAHVNLMSGKAHVDDLTATLLGGRLNGRLLADFTGAVPVSQTDLKLEALQMDQLSKAMGFLPSLITGSLSAQQVVTVKGTSVEDFRRTASGMIRFNITDGTIRKMDVLGKIISLLNFKRLVSGKRVDVSREGEPFDSVKGTLRLRRGMMATDDIKMEGPALDMAAKGTLNLQDQQVNMVASALGMEFDVQGPADNPTVSSRAMKGFQEGAGHLVDKGLSLFR